ncbi:unnamed protein product [Bursaphelenchus xylophilus]|uniref:(pine wood nematode) hypothetical protein n=1 Tax=Bursaphelenchus xylophilus TaxID=6326 RepID=A0A1I7SWZ0_BURXY|nr:unnamed protein product [Bursaphelenchus xylophilus]CAG9100060.1 unnamed protein product [Bursaphelenchus xylophilus]
MPTKGVLFILLSALILDVHAGSLTNQSIFFDSTKFETDFSTIYLYNALSIALSLISIGCSIAAIVTLWKNRKNKQDNKNYNIGPAASESSLLFV